MSKLLAALKSYLESEIEGALAAAPGRELRAVFAGPPVQVLNELFATLVGSDGRFVIKSVGISMPVFVLSAGAEDPDSIRSAKCTPSFLVKVRTSECRRFLALLPQDELTNVSIDSTMVWLSSQSGQNEFDQWKTHPMIDSLLRSALSQCPSKLIERVRVAAEHRLQEAWEQDEGFKDKRRTWSVLQRIFETDSIAAPPLDRFAALLGLVRADEDEFATKEHLSCLLRIGDVLEAQGLMTGCLSFEEQSDEDLKSHLGLFREHILERCTTSADFVSSPSAAYSPPIVGGGLPNWWNELTLDSWNRVLEAPAEKETEADLSVICQPLIPAMRGMPIVVRKCLTVAVGSRSEEQQIHVEIARAVGAGKFEVIDSVVIKDSDKIEWTDRAVPSHEKYLRYKFEAVGHKDAVIKVISLNSFGPGVVLYCRGADKISPFKLNAKAKNEQGQRCTRYECELKLHGIGAHQLDIYTGEHLVLGDLITGYEVSSERDEKLVRPIIPVSGASSHSIAIIETDEESYFEFTAKEPASGVEQTYRIWVQSGEDTPIGASSEFDRLLIEHRGGSRTERINARAEFVPSRLNDLQVWTIEDEFSFYPLVLGPDYLEQWSKPEWSNLPVYSKHALLLDPRPTVEELKPPAELISARAELLGRFKPNVDDPVMPMEMLRLGELMADTDFAAALSLYITSYTTWLKQDYNAAAWFDVVTIHSKERGSRALAPVPAAILLSPLHPVRLAWQCIAQDLLGNALAISPPCPGASILEPHSAPDCIALPCRSATGQFENQYFLSMRSTSDYWGVYWNQDRMGDFGTGDFLGFFNPEFGLQVEGLTTGFSVQQVTRSIEEVRRLSSAKSTLTIQITSDTSGDSSCNAGIDKWCTENLGPDGDEWHEAGPITLHVFDQREKELHPEQATLASLTERTDAAVRWFVKGQEIADLAIVAHLGVSSPSVQNQGLRSAVDSTGLTRFRIRRQLPGGNGVFIAESRVGCPHNHNASGQPADLLVDCIETLESACMRKFDSYVFAPRMPTLEDAVETARYCAVSSSSVDAASFFRGTSKSLLWDYELPSYARRAGENSGYYLLARHTPSMISAVQAAVQRLSTDALSGELVSSLLNEISRRGMPTLKQLTVGGATSFGEIGILVALRLLQADFQSGSEGSGLLSIMSGTDVLNLLIPVDPFQSHFDDLRGALDRTSWERPDILIASIRITDGIPDILRLTAIEVKARDGVMASPERAEALKQASSFCIFLSKLQNQAANPIWGIAWRNLLASLLDYAFRVYGQLPQFVNQDRWSELHALTLQELLAGKLKVDVDLRGRLILIDASSISSPADSDKDGFTETIVLTHKDAFNVLTSQARDTLEAIGQRVKNWALEAKADTFTQSNLSLPNIETQFEERDHSSAIAAPIEEVQKQEIDKPAVPITGSETAGLRFSVGNSIDAFVQQDYYFFPGNTQLNQLNMGIVGDLGTGKTQLIQALLLQLRESVSSNRGVAPQVLIFDYKRDYVKDEFVRAVDAQVLRPFDIPLNLFDIAGSEKPNAWLERSKFFSDVLDKIYSGIGPLQRHSLKEAVRNAYEKVGTQGTSPTMYDVFDSYRERGQSVDSPYSIMSDIVDGQYFARDASTIMPFSKLLTKGVIVLDLAAVGQDDRTKNMLVAIFLNLFYEHMLQIDKRPFVGTDPKLRFVDTMLLVDEADNIMQYEFDVLKKLLLQGREFGVGVILASQYLTHFKTRSENYMEPLLTWFIHKVPNISVKDLQALGIPRADNGMTDRIKTLRPHECLYKTYDVDGEFIRATPFFELVSNRVFASED